MRWCFPVHLSIATRKSAANDPRKMEFIPFYDRSLATIQRKRGARPHSPRAPIIPRTWKGLIGERCHVSAAAVRNRPAAVQPAAFEMSL